MEALEQLKGVLCDPEGNVCIHGSDEDRRIVQKFIDGYADQLREAQVKVLREAASRFSGTNAQWVINRMADKLENDAIRGLA